ncbi:MAG: universal stress protein [Desulfovibrionaceae bacterium]|jgi:nucleotide-binding universal stress UspA family protein|nr:universal stress protein [Desulfovibrionaceae bacterium]
MEQRETLNRSVILAVQADRGAPLSLAFLSALFADKGDVRCDLVCVAGSPAAWLREAADPAVLAARLALQHRAEAALARAREHLQAHGYPAHNLTTRLWMRDFGAVAEVLREIGRELPDAVLLDRDLLDVALPYLEEPTNLELLRGSVSFPIWCSEPEDEDGAAGAPQHAVTPDPARVLVCLDGSRPSIAAADHASFVLAPQPNALLTLLHVDGDAEPEAAARVFQRARGELANNGFAPERVVERVLPSDSRGPAETILALAEREGFSAVAMGRTGAGERPGRAQFLGSTAARVLDALRSATLWLTP